MIKNLEDKREKAAKVVDRQVHEFVKTHNSWRSLVRALDTWAGQASSRKEKLNLLKLKKDFVNHSDVLWQLISSMGDSLNDL